MTDYNPTNRQRTRRERIMRLRALIQAADVNRERRNAVESLDAKKLRAHFMLTWAAELAKLEKEETRAALSSGRCRHGHLACSVCDLKGKSS